MCVSLSQTGTHHIVHRIFELAQEGDAPQLCVFLRLLSFEQLPCHWERKGEGAVVSVSHSSSLYEFIALVNKADPPSSLSCFEQP